MTKEEKSALYELFQKESKNHQEDDLNIFYSAIHNSMSYSNEKGTLRMIFYKDFEENMNEQEIENVLVSRALWRATGEKSARTVMDVSLALSGDKFVVHTPCEDGRPALDKLPQEFAKVCEDYKDNAKGFYNNKFLYTKVNDNSDVKKAKNKYEIDR